MGKTKGATKRTIKAKKDLRGSGKFGWGESGKLHSTIKRLSATMDLPYRGKKRRKEVKPKEVEQLSSYTSPFNGVTIRPGDTVTFKLGGSYAAGLPAQDHTRVVESIFNDLVSERPNNPRIKFKESGRLVLTGFGANHHSIESWVRGPFYLKPLTKP